MNNKAELVSRKVYFAFLGALSPTVSSRHLLNHVSCRVNSYVQQVLELLSSHLPESLSVQELAQQGQCCTSYLSRLFDLVERGSRSTAMISRKANMVADLF